MKRNQKRSPLGSMLRLTGNRRLLTAMITVAMLRNLRDLACVITLAFATNQVLLGTNVGPAIVLMALAMFSGAPIIALDNFFSTKFYLKSQRKIQLAMAERISGLPLAWVETHKSGDVLSTYTADMELVCGWMSGVFPGMLRFVTYLLGALIYSLAQSALLTVIVFPVIILIMPLLTKLAEPLKRTSEVQRQAAAASLADMQEVLADPAFLKAYSLESAMDDRIGEALAVKRRAEQKSGFSLGLVRALSFLGSYLPGFVAAAAGVWFLWKGMITAGFLVGFIQMVVQRFGQALPQVGEFSTETNTAAASAKRIMDLLDQPQERTDGETGILDHTHVLDLDHVTFAYHQDTPVLRAVSLHADLGETVALVGASGSGKSTVLKLLMGLYEAQQGTVKVLGRDVRLWNLQALRDLMAPVFQDASLFPMSIRENIAGREVPEQSVRDALKHAGLEEFIDSLPAGLDTPVGERGVTLSGGQQQRLTIARALVKDAPVIILDEPTSALDTVTENEFQAAFETLKRGKTAMIVAHRLQTIRSADRIYVFEHGSVVQEGTHESLISQEGAYRRLYQTQLEGQEAGTDA